MTARFLARKLEQILEDDEVTTMSYEALSAAAGKEKLEEWQSMRTDVRQEKLGRGKNAKKVWVSPYTTDRTASAFYWSYLHHLSHIRFTLV